MKSLLKLGAVLAVFVAAQGTTLQKLSLDDMILKSTAIVHCTVQPTNTAARGSIIYTHYTVRSLEVWKGSVYGPIDLAVPGGSANGVRETYAGAPGLAVGSDYVLFLWTSKTGLTQVIGLSQGLFTVTTNSAGVPMVSRTASSEPMLDGSLQPVTDSDFQMSLDQLRSRVQSTLAAQAGPAGS
jgi:hypothetical protein